MKTVCVVVIGSWFQDMTGPESVHPDEKAARKHLKANGWVVSKEERTFQGDIDLLVHKEQRMYAHLETVPMFE